MSNIESEIRLFADDCVCYREIKDIEDTLKLQKDIDRLGIWARKWGMRFQPVKCNMMQLTKKHNKIQASYTLEGTVLENVDSIKYLGVTITSDFHDSFLIFAPLTSICVDRFLNKTNDTCVNSTENRLTKRH